MGQGTLILTSLLISKRSDTRSSGHSQVEQPLTAELYAILHSHEISRVITAISPFVETWEIRSFTIAYVNVSITTTYGAKKPIMRNATKPVRKCFTKDERRRCLKRKVCFWSLQIPAGGHADKREAARAGSLPVVGFIIQERVNEPDNAPNQRDGLYIRLEAVLALERR